MTNTRLTGIGQDGSPPAPRRPAASVKDRESLRGLRATIQLAPIGIFHCDVDGRFLLANLRFAEILGVSPAQLLTRTLQEVVHSDDLPDLIDVTRRLVTGEMLTHTGERRLVHADGATAWVRLSLAPIQDSAGQFAFLTGIADDVSADRREALAHREAEERLHAALLASAVGTYRWDFSTNVVECDETLAALFGFEAGEQVRTLEEFLERIHPEDRERVRAGCDRCAREAAIFEEEYRVVRADGDDRCVYDKGRTFADAEGRPSYMTGACTDVTDHRRTELELHATESRLHRITDSGIVGVFYTQADQLITDANDAFLRMIGYTREDLAARRLNGRELTAAAWRETANEKVAEALSLGACGPWEQEFVARDGRSIPVLVAHARLDHPRDHCIGISLDISETKVAEQERERLLVREQVARRNAEEAMQLRDEVLGVVAHDLRNPIHTILMSASALIELTVPEEQRRRHIGIIRRTARAMDRLIRDLLDVRRMEAGTLEVRTDGVNVTDLVSEALESFESEARSRGLTLACDIAPDLPEVLGDHDRLGQVLSNLVGNAMKFTPRGGNVGIHAHHVNDHVEISVTDNGPGIPPQIISSVFNRFWQADKSSRSGAGLGLAIARGIVEAHGGHIWVESIVGHGTAFRFTVPCSDAGPPVETAMAP